MLPNLLTKSVTLVDTWHQLIQSIDNGQLLVSSKLETVISTTEAPPTRYLAHPAILQMVPPSNMATLKSSTVILMVLQPVSTNSEYYY